MTDIELAYIAGIVDGEGTITLMPNNTNKNREYATWYPRCSICNTNKALLLWIQGLAGGTIYATTSKENTTRKPCFALVFGLKQSRTFVEQLVPYLRVKREQAEILLRYPKRLHISQGRGKPPLPNVAMYEVQRGLADQIHLLNRRGL